MRQDVRRIVQLYGEITGKNFGGVKQTSGEGGEDRTKGS